MKMIDKKFSWRKAAMFLINMDYFNSLYCIMNIMQLDLVDVVTFVIVQIFRRIRIFRRIEVVFEGYLSRRL